MDRDNIDILLKTKMPGPKASSIVARDKLVQAKSTEFYAFVRAFDDKAIGPFCTDIDGNIVMDFTGQVAAAPLGYNHPEIMELLHKLPPTVPAKYAGTDFYAASAQGLPSPTDLKEKILESTQMYGFERVFLSNSGAEAVENAMKVCHAKRGRGYGIGFERAFHGRTLGALSLNQSKLMHRMCYPRLPDILSIPYCSEAKTDCNCGFWAYDKKQRNVISKLEQMLNPKTGIIAPHEVAYIIFEPVQGEGGYFVASDAFMQELKRMREEYAIPLIADEIQSGIGRTGKLWAVEHFGLSPDIITAAKALQVGATMGKDYLFPKEGGRISSTWGGGDIVNSIIGYKTLDIILRDKLWENAKCMGDYFIGELRKLQEQYNMIIDVRGIGLMDAIEFQTQKQRDLFEEECFRKGLMVLGCGYKAVRILPPLDVRKRELDIALNVTEDVLKSIGK